MQDNKLISSGGEPAEFNIEQKECLSIDQIEVPLMNGGKELRTFCAGYAIRVLSDERSKKDILIRELRNDNREGVLAEWILGKMIQMKSA